MEGLTYLWVHIKPWAVGALAKAGLRPVALDGRKHNCCALVSWWGRSACNIEPVIVAQLLAHDCRIFSRPVGVANSAPLAVVENLDPPLIAADTIPQAHAAAHCDRGN